MIVVLDTSVLLNFLRIGRTDLIAVHPFTFVTVPEVAKEVFRLRGQVQYEMALSAGHIEQWSRIGPAEAKMYRGLLVAGNGEGESEAIAVALSRGYGLSLDDEKAIKHAEAKAHQLGRSPVILRTRDIVVDLIENEELSVEQADSFLAEWAAKHKFKLKISSSRECVGDHRKR